MNQSTVDILKEVQAELENADLQKVLDLAQKPPELVAHLKIVFERQDFKEEFKKGLKLVSLYEQALVMKNLSTLTYYFPSLCVLLAKVTKYLAL